MLRRFYRFLLRLHPRRFRNRFGDEMLSIFDEANKNADKPETARLFTDAVTSFLRQWLARPEIWEEQVAEPIRCSSAGPVLFTLGEYKPRTGSLISGGFVTLILFCAAWFVSEYTWTHPVFMPLTTVQVDTAYEQPENSELSPLPLASIPSEQVPVPQAQATATVETSAPARATPPPRPNSAKVTVVPLTKNGAIAGTPILRNEPAQNSATIASADRPSRVTASPAISEDVLQSYVGVYAAPNVQIVIASENGNLTMQIGGETKTVLVPAGGSQFRLASSSSDWVQFSKDHAGAVRAIEVSRGGHRLSALRTTTKPPKTPE